MTANKLAYSIVHNRRSGGHAVVNWLFGHFEGKVIGHSNSNTWGKPKYRMSTWMLPDAASTERDGTVRNSTKPLDKRCRLDSLAPHLEKDFLIVSYEDSDVNTWLPSVPQREFGSVGEHKRIIILRSFYNVMASRIAFMRYDDPTIKRFHAPGYRPDRIDMWLNHAKFFESSSIVHDYVRISFDMWFESFEYRRAVELDLKLSPSDDRLNMVPPEGGGSSFDKRKKKTHAQSMKVNQRWMSIDSWPDEVLENEEARHLNLRLFGWALDREGKLVVAQDLLKR